jgi:hypothetical protein
MAATIGPVAVNNVSFQTTFRMNTERIHLRKDSYVYDCKQLEEI